MHARILLLAFLISFSSGYYAQAQEDCTEIKVEVRINGDEVYLDFNKGLDYKDFKLFLFDENGRKNNRLDFSAKEIKGIPKGTYLLVIQANSDKFCPKQINLKIN